MASRTYHVISEYEAPALREGCVDPEAPEDVAVRDALAWSQSQTFGVSRRIAKPPKFVKPSGLYDVDGRPIVLDEDEDDEIQIIGHNPNDISSWYRNLKREAGTPPPPLPPPLRPSEPPTSITVSGNIRVSSKKDPTWFLARTLKNQSSGSSTPSSFASSSSSLADMLSRAPPPLPSEAPFVPPVWTMLGPGNQGYGMLRKFGWEEGKPLGLSAPEPDKVAQGKWDDENGTGGARRMGIGFKNQESTCEIVDLTADSDDEDGNIHMTSAACLGPASPLKLPTARPHHDGKALLTPLPTVLRGDRSGIGSKSSLTKTIKHTSEAIQLLELRKKRNSRRGPVVPDTSVGGARISARMAKRDARDRVELLTSLQS